MVQIPRPQEIYKHFKGNFYQIITIAIHSETGEPMVVYQALYGDYKVYVRPLDMFLSEVDHEKYPEVTQKLRFELIQQTIPYELKAEEAAGQKNPAEEIAGEPATGVTEESSKEPSGEPAEKSAASPARESSEETLEEALDPMVLSFLDADSYEEKLEILDGLHQRITDEMITTMALCCDIEVKEGDLETRYDELRSCLLTLEKYECRRLR